MIIRDFGEKYINQFTGEVFWGYLFVDRKWNLDEINKYYSIFDFKLFLSYQSLSSEMILNLEPIINETNSWSTIIRRQILSPDIIMWCKSKVNFTTDFIKNQHWEPWMIYSLSSDELDCVGGINNFSIYQLLPDEFILENKNQISIDNILKCQRITPRLISELKIDKNKLSTKYSLRENIFYDTDIGRDWFFAYIGRSKKEYEIPKYYIMHPEVEPECFYNSSLKKVRVWYKDQIGSWYFKNVEIIREIGSVGSFIKRFPPSIKP